jgi:LCP family protein required for cell wall assembly
MSDRPAARDQRKIHIPAPGAGGPSGPPPAPGGRSGARNGAAQAPSSRPATSKPKAAPKPKAASQPKPKAKAAPSTRSAGRGGRRRGRRVLRLAALALPLLLVVGLIAGFLWASSIWNRIEKVPVADVLSTGGAGTNYLIVGSDSRDPQALIDAGLNPEAFQGGGGDRSDTMVLLRFGDGGPRMLSIPRDLFVPIAETGSSQKINAAYNGGPRRLILTVQESLGLPVHHYMEVDFVSFASLVDSLGGVTVDFEHPAFDPGSGLQVDQAGPVELDGPQGLAYVRSRQYTEVIDGRNRTDPTADLGRIERQQRFLGAVFSELGASRNPLTLGRAASGASGGLRLDDRMSMVDGARLAWRLRSLDPERFQIPVDTGSNQAGSVLFLRQPDADTVLSLFR